MEPTRDARPFSSPPYTLCPALAPDQANTSHTGAALDIEASNSLHGERVLLVGMVCGVMRTIPTARGKRDDEGTNDASYTSGHMSAGARER